MTQCSSPRTTGSAIAGSGVAAGAGDEEQQTKAGKDVSDTHGRHLAD